MNGNKLIPVIGLGAGGHAKVIIDALHLSGEFDIIGLLDSNQDLWNTQVLGVPVLGNDKLLTALSQQGVKMAFIGLGGAGNNAARKLLYEKARDHGFCAVRTIHPQSIVSSWASIGCGPTILAGAVVNAAAQLGDNVIVNTGAIVEHDCSIGHHVHIATGARLASTVRIGNGSHIGAGATIRQSINIGEEAIVGAGAVVIRDVPDHTTVVGVPARELRHRPSPATPMQFEKPK